LEAVRDAVELYWSHANDEDDVTYDGCDGDCDVAFERWRAVMTAVAATRPEDAGGSEGIVATASKTRTPTPALTEETG